VKRKIRDPYPEESGRSFSGICSLLLIFFLLLPLSGCGKEEKVQPQPPTVEVAEVTQKDVPVISEWVGTTDGVVNATIRAQVQGYLTKQNYTEGQLVRQGQVLFEIDPREYQAALDQAKAVLSQSKGALDQSKAGLSQSKGAVEQTKASLEKAKAEVSVQDARWTTAKANLARVKPLAEQNAVSKKDLDDAVGAELSTRSAVDAAKAAVDAAQANIVAAEAQVVGAQANIVAAEAQVLGSQAAVEKAQLNLGFTKVISPVDGIAGIAKAQIGNLVGPGSVEELTTVSTIDPIKCYVSISEQEYMRAQEKKAGQAGKIPLDLILSDGTVYPHKGEVAFADRQVDVRTGTIRVGTLFPNPQNLLRPGMFSRVRAEMGIRKGALVIPQRAVSEVQGRYLVAVVGAENKVAIKPVKVGQWFGQLWVIDEGLKAGEKVVAEGIQKVRDGMVVSPKPFVAGGQAEPGAAQKPEAKPEGKPETKSETKPEAKPQPKPQSKPEKR
jgi:membrane fusion protein (multidrug efflux system)